MRFAISYHCIYGTRIYGALGWAFGIRALYEKKSAMGRGYRHMFRSLHHFFNDSDFAFPTSLERSHVLLILRTHRQFTGRVWLAYDKAFRKHAAAMKLVDWSSINIQLYNFCTAGASVRGGPDGLFSNLPKPFGVTSSQVICRSWN